MGGVRSCVARPKVAGCWWSNEERACMLAAGRGGESSLRRVELLRLLERWRSEWGEGRPASMDECVDAVKRKMRRQAAHDGLERRSV